MLFRFGIIALSVFLAYQYFGGAKSNEWEIQNFLQNPEVIVAFGDSLTRGQGAPEGGAYPDILANKIGVSIINSGINGLQTGGALEALEQSVIAKQPQMVLLTIGGNDMIRKVAREQSVANLSAIFSRLVSAGIMVVYLNIDPPLVSSKWYKDYKKTAKEHGVVWVDRSLKGLWGDSNYMADQIHPNAKGYEVVANRVYERLIELKIIQ